MVMTDTVEKRRMRFGIVPTYRCNKSCQYCNRHLHQWSWPGTDLTSEQLKIAGEDVHARGIQPGRIRFTGGEPLMHRQFPELVDIVLDTWKPAMRLVSFSNGTISLPKIQRRGMRFRSERTDESFHRPWMISPKDLGIKAHGGWKGYCSIQNGCGRLFDCHGFSFCVFAGALGRILGIDPYSRDPKVPADLRICQHCICSVRVRHRFRLQQNAMDGKIPFPTKTYRDAIEGKTKLQLSFRRYEERDE
jgi:hypothetical protein